MEDFATSIVCILSNLKFKYKLTGLLFALKELESSIGCSSLLMAMLDQLPFYESWIQTCSTLIIELWSMGYADYFYPKSENNNLSSTLLHNSKQLPSPTNNSIDSDQFVQNRQFFRHFQHDSFLWTYMIKPNRKFNQFCIILNQIVKHLPRSHIGYPLCQSVFATYILLLRNVQPQLDECERIEFLLHLSCHLFPVESYLLGPNYIDVKMLTHLDHFVQDMLNKLKNHHVIRLGWLEKYSRRGFQSRLCILMPDWLIYANRIKDNCGFFFKVHGIICLQGTSIDLNTDSIDKIMNANQSLNSTQDANYRFSLIVTHANSKSCIDLNQTTKLTKKSCPELHKTHLSSLSWSSSNSSLTNATVQKLKKCRQRFIFKVLNQQQFNEWTSDLKLVIDQCKNKKCKSVSFEANGKESQQLNRTNILRFRDQQTSKWICYQISQQRSNGLNKNQNRYKSKEKLSSKMFNSDHFGFEQKCLLKLYWSQKMSVSQVKMLNLINCETSGYLMRLSKRGSAWQRLWTVLKHNSLIFYKHPTDLKCLVNLSLLNYKLVITKDVSITNAIKQENDRYYIKLFNHTKNYYFYAESDINFIKWYEALFNVLNPASHTLRFQLASNFESANLECMKNLWPSSILDAKLVFTCIENK